MNFIHNSIYIHVPKTGGSSFETMLQHQGFPVIKDQHSTAIDLSSQQQQMFVFGFVRNPYVVEVSNYRYHEFSWNTGMSFEQWCVWRFTEHRDWADEFDISQQQKHYGHEFAVNAQAGYFCNSQGQCVADAIYHYEHLQHNVQEICNLLNLKNTMKRYNVMNYGFFRTKDHRSYYTPLSYDIVTAARAVDLELLGYNFFDQPHHHKVTNTDYALNGVDTNYAYRRLEVSQHHGLCV